MSDLAAALGAGWLRYRQAGRPKVLAAFCGAEGVSCGWLHRCIAAFGIPAQVTAAAAEAAAAAGAFPDLESMLSR